MVPPPPSRQAVLTRLYDRLGAESATDGESAAREAAAGNDQDRRFMASLWGTRARSAIGARRFADALSRAARHQEAFDWYERAFHFVGADDPLLHWLRYEMAREYVALGRNRDAINLLGNRSGASPIPAELKPKYDELIKRAS
jgi:tetratricopeptide (TPR) repeat protein